jgi:Leucine-rich repeat (LRR) protein
LQIRNNKLTELPDLFALEELELVDVSNNLLSTVACISIPKLSKLNLSFNRITDFPSIEKPNKNLKNLILGHNKLTHIPNLEFIDNLEELQLNNNEIESL